MVKFEVNAAAPPLTEPFAAAAPLNVTPAMSNSGDESSVITNSGPAVVLATTVRVLAAEPVVVNAVHSEFASLVALKAWTKKS